MAPLDTHRLRAWVGFDHNNQKRFFDRTSNDLAYYFHRPAGPVIPYDQNEQIAGYGDLWISTWIDNDRLLLANGDGYGLSFYHIDQNYFFLSPPAPPIPTPTPLRAPIISISQFAGHPGVAVQIVPDNVNRSLFHLYDSHYFADPSHQGSFSHVFERNLKPTGLLSVDNELYLAFSEHANYWDALSDSIAAGIFHSSGQPLGGAWTPAVGSVLDVDAAILWNHAKFTTPVFFQFGKNYADYPLYDASGDRYVYALSIRRQWWNQSEIYLGRVPVTQLRVSAAWEYYRGIDQFGIPLWTSDLDAAVAILYAPDEIGQPSIIYCNALAQLTEGKHSFLMTTWSNSGRFDYDTRQDKRFFVWVAPHPWGPWKKIATADYNGLQNDGIVDGQMRNGFGGYHAQLVPKWIESDANRLTLWVLLSGFFNINFGTPAAPNSDLVAFNSYSMMFAPLYLEYESTNAALLSSRSVLHQFDTNDWQRLDSGIWPVSIHVGFQFAVSRPLTVTYLGRLYNSGNAETHALRLVELNPDDSEAILSQIQIDFSLRENMDEHGFYYAALTSPVVLQPGHRYVLSSEEANLTDVWWGFNEQVDLSGQYCSDRVMASDFLGGSISSMAPAWVGEAGIKLKINRPLRITALGRLRVPGNSQVHDMRLYQKIGNNVTQIISSLLNIASAPLDQLYLYAALPTAITLQPGDYYLVSSESSSGDAFLGDAADPATFPSLVSNSSAVEPFPIEFAGAVRHDGILANDPWFEIPGDPALCFGPVNLRFIDNNYANLRCGNSVIIQHPAFRLDDQAQWTLNPNYISTFSGDCYGPVNFRYTPVESLLATVDLNSAPLRFWDGFAGFRFTTGLQPMRVLALLRYGTAILSSHELRLMAYRELPHDANRFEILSLLSSVVVDMNSPTYDQYKRADLMHPVILQPGTSYMLVSREFNAADAFYGNSFQMMPLYASANAITLRGPVFSEADLWRNDVNDLSHWGYGPVNLLFD